MMKKSVFFLLFIGMIGNVAPTFCSTASTDQNAAPVNAPAEEAKWDAQAIKKAIIIGSSVATAGLISLIAWKKFSENAADKKNDATTETPTEKKASTPVPSSDQKASAKNKTHLDDQSKEDIIYVIQLLKYTDDAQNAIEEQQLSDKDLKHELQQVAIIEQIRLFQNRRKDPFYQDEKNNLLKQLQKRIKEIEKHSTNERLKERQFLQAAIEIVKPEFASKPESIENLHRFLITFQKHVHAIETSSMNYKEKEDQLYRAYVECSSK